MLLKISCLVCISNSSLLIWLSSLCMCMNTTLLRGHCHRERKVVIATVTVENYENEDNTCYTIYETVIYLNCGVEQKIDVMIAVFLMPSIQQQENI